MTLVEFIDIVLTPIGGGVGAVIGASLLAKNQPEMFGQFSSWGKKLGVGVVVALVLFALKVL